MIRHALPHVRVERRNRKLLASDHEIQRGYHVRQAQPKFVRVV
jgi:hypothetical protein